MCGRFAAYFEAPELVDWFGVTDLLDPPGPSWNIAPTSQIALVRDLLEAASGRLQRELRGARWGLVPTWSKTLTSGPRLINARSETVTVKASYRAAARARRALIPAAGYYEWQAADQGPKTPYYLHPPEANPIALAGLYDWWWPPDVDRRENPDAAPPLLTAVIITRAATDSTGEIHDRMPLIVPAEAWDAWLDPGLKDPAAIDDMIRTLPDPELIPRRVGRAVGSVKNDGPGLIEPVG